MSIKVYRTFTLQLEQSSYILKHSCNTNKTWFEIYWNIFNTSLKHKYPPWEFFLIAIWLIFTRTVTPLEIFRWFPQIVFTLLTCVRPINVGFSNRFFCLSDKRCLMLIIKKNVEEDKS